MADSAVEQRRMARACSSVKAIVTNVPQAPQKIRSVLSMIRRCASRIVMAAGRARERVADAVWAVVGAERRHVEYARHVAVN